MPRMLKQVLFGLLGVFLVLVLLSALGNAGPFELALFVPLGFLVGWFVLAPGRRSA